MMNRPAIAHKEASAVPSVSQYYKFIMRTTERKKVHQQLDQLENWCKIFQMNEQLQKDNREKNELLGERQAKSSKPQQYAAKGKRLRPDQLQQKSVEISEYDKQSLKIGDLASESE